jgi:hypothetical protein
MLFQYTYEAILEGRKTQTRRVRHSSDQAVEDEHGDIIAVLVNGREKWRVGKTYSIQPARGKPQIGRIRILAIGAERVSNISENDVEAEGFVTKVVFLRTWVEINGEAQADAIVWVLRFEPVK